MTSSTHPEPLTEADAPPLLRDPPPPPGWEDPLNGLDALGGTGAEPEGHGSSGS